MGISASRARRILNSPPKQRQPKPWSFQLSPKIYLIDVISIVGIFGAFLILGKEKRNEPNKQAYMVEPEEVTFGAMFMEKYPEVADKARKIFGGSRDQ